MSFSEFEVGGHQEGDPKDVVDVYPSRDRVKEALSLHKIEAWV